MTARKVLMVAPKNFISNPQTVGDNFFQEPLNAAAEEDLAGEATKEFDGLKNLLTEAGIEVKVFKQHDDLVTPDALFPNNWFSTFPDNSFAIYPMMAENRRLERRPEMISYLRKNYAKQIDLTHDEKRGIFLEGTGSLVMDHAHKIAYASLSQRTSSNVTHEWGKLTGYDVILFSSYDRNKELIYHTNVMMCVAEKFAVVCLESLEDEDARERVKFSLAGSGHEIIEITLEQVHHFCGNCLELENKNGDKFFIMSDEAYDHFSDDLRQRIEKNSKILHTGLHTIEKVGGGGVRCMMAELF